MRTVGVQGKLLPVDPRPGDPLARQDEVLRPAAEVVHALVEHVGDALRECGDLDRVTARLEHLLAHGTGARRQRDTYECTGSLAAVVTDAVEATAAPPR